MIGRSELRLSLEMIERTKRRLRYQEAAVHKLSLDRDDDNCVRLAKEMQAILEEKIARLLAKHASLIEEAKQ